MTIKHLLIDCPNFNLARQKIIDYLNDKQINLDEKSILDDHFDHNLLFTFLKETNYYRKI